jgi:hypothetical protein
MCEVSIGSELSADGPATLICLLFTNQSGYAGMHTRNQLHLEKYLCMI